jgi:UDP-glucose 4-epimerase
MTDTLQKLIGEYYASIFSGVYGLETVSLRYFNVYGPRMDIHGVYTEVLVRWMERIASGQPPLIMGDGLQTMDFVFIDDVARANLAALRSDADDEVFNIASGVETSLNELAQALLNAMNSNLSPEYIAERQVNPVRRRLANVSKARKLLGFESRVGLEEGLVQLVRWWESVRVAEVQA